MHIGQINLKNIMELIEFKGQKIPSFQASGFAARFVFPFAKEFCKGLGYDIGCGKLEWALPDSIPIDITLDNNNYNADILPTIKVDYIFSSHCLEHLENWVTVLDYWYTRIKKGGILFLYLSSYNSVYWRPWNNKKHIHVLDRFILTDYLRDRGYINIFSSGVDLNNSFTIVAEKT